MKTLRQPFGPEEFAAAFNVPPDHLEKFRHYEAMLRQWQPIKNLVANATLDEIWLRHFADSAQLLQFATGPTDWVDLGSGAGFPGIVIALLSINDSKHRITLVESNARKCSFLRTVIRELGLGVSTTVVTARIEDAALPLQVAARERIITARALASLEQLCAWSLPFWSDQTRAVFLKGEAAEREVERARLKYAFEAAFRPSCTQAAATIIELRSVKRL